MAKQDLNYIQDATHPAGDSPGPAGVLASYNGNVGKQNAMFTELYAATDWTLLGDYADDAAAAVGGVALGKLYRTGNAVKVRLA